MFNRIFNIIWGGLTIWTCLVPNGYAPYILLGVNGGDCFITLWVGLKDGYLEKEGDFNLGRFVTTLIGFGLLGGFYAGNLSFQPGTDAYNNALYFIFASFWLTFGFRFLQYGLLHLMKRF